MEKDRSTMRGDELESQEYQTLVMLDALETLLENLEDNGITSLEGNQGIPMDLKQRMDALGVHNVQQVRDKLIHLHAQVDQDEGDLTITES